jgi:hypothetical protein
VLLSERRLRLLMGITPSDCKLIRPTDEPNAAKIDFDWCQVTREATTRRAELRKEKFQIRRRELELIGSKNNLLPRLDGVGRYRWRGFGDTLFPDKEPPLPRFDNAYEDLTSGDFQEWQLGFELNVPIGFRAAHVATRNAELQLARERAILRDQQREVMHEAADAVSELDRAYVVLQTSYNRLAANHDQLGSVQAAFENDKVPLDLYLDAQRRVSESEIDYHLNRVRYTLAGKNVHFVKGTLLDYDGVSLAEGPWPCDAQEEAAQREARRGRPKPLNYISSKAPVVAVGPFDQNAGCCDVNAATSTPPIPTAVPTQPDSLPSPSDVQPLPAQPSTVAPPGGAGAKPASPAKLTQPETIQTSAIDIKKRYPIIGAGFTDHAAEPALPQIALRPGTVPESATAAEPQRLPPTGSAQ